MKRAHVLVIDDDRDVEQLIRKALSGAEIQRDADPSSALSRLDTESFDLVLAAHAPPQRDGLSFLAAVQKIDPRLPVILLADKPTVEGVTAALRQGAADYLARPLSPEDLVHSAERVLAGRRLDARGIRL